MDDLRQRFATLDRVPVPDVWADVERRLEALGSRAPTWRPVAMKPQWRGAANAKTPLGSATEFNRRRSFGPLAAAALLTALLIGGAVAVGSGLVRLPSIVPPSPDASPSFVSPSPDASPSFVSPRATSTPATSTLAAWSTTGGMTAQRESHTATALLNGRVLVAGGCVGCVPGVPVAAELYDPVARTWSSTGSLTTERRFHTASLLADGRVLVAGGMVPGLTGITESDPATSLDSSELYEPTTGTWSATGTMITARHGHTATVLSDGRVLVAGGSEAGPDSPGDGSYGGRVLKSSELYDPRTGTWIATGSMSTAREGQAAILLADGQVLVIGGERGGQIIASAELYDPSTGTWSPTGEMGIGVFTAVLLADGRVLVAGSSASAELYDPTTATWTATGSMTTPRSEYTASVLANGKVLVAGGNDPSSTSASAELYDPTSGIWTAAPAMATPRKAHTAVLLTDGNVLIAGGEKLEPHLWLNSAELYIVGSGN